MSGGRKRAVECDLELLEAYLLLRADSLLALVAVEQRLLLLDQLVNTAENPVVFHAGKLADARQGARIRAQT